MSALMSGTSARRAVARRGGLAGGSGQAARCDPRRVSSGGIIVASLVAYFAGEFTNSYILARVKVLTSGR